MMVDQNGYSLNFDKFENIIKVTWQDLQNDQDFCDVTLACEDKQITVHKIVLSSSSSIFKDILKQFSNPNPIIYLNGVRYKDLQNLLSFIYQGEVKIASEDLCNLLQVADDLKIRGLSKDSEKSSYSNVPPVSENKQNKIDFLPKPKDVKNELDKEKDYLDWDQKSSMDFIENSMDTEKTDENEEFNTNIVQTAKSVKQLNENVPSSENKYLKFIKFTEVIDTDKKENEEILDKSIDIYTDHKVEYIAKTNKNNFKKVEHKNEIWYICNLCDHKSKAKQHIKINVQSLHDKLILMCDQCNKQYTNPRSLRRHKDLIHLGKRYACDQCNRQFGDIRGVKEHKETAHEGAIYQCRQCDYKAVQKQTFNNHIKTIHEGITYPCDQCDVRTTQKQNLKKHIDSVHEKIYNPCDKCDKKYVDIGGLRKHKATAHKEDMYSCDKCDYRTVENITLLRHVKTIHNNKDMEIEFELHN